MAIERAKFEIIAVPQGGAPLWVRQQWLGIIVNGFVGVPLETGDLVEVGTGKPVGSYEAVHVAQVDAIYELTQKPGAEQAAKWWTEHGYPSSPFAAFAFRKDELRPISGFEPVPENSNSPDVWDTMDPRGAHNDIPGRN
ncbi:MAG: hypothetical protein K0S38_745 [Candidatus Paceibacter sp.]|jgi:hypothetical protein|nr:hypothetical protein [Candidatus Paceibacter sp.]